MSDESELIHLPNVLKAKASWGGHEVDRQALAQADALIAGMSSAYLQWAEEDLQRIDEAFVRACAAQADRRTAAMRSVFAIAHDIKGQGGSFHYPLMTVIGGQLCTFVDRAPDFGEQELEVVRLHIDAMRLVIGRRMHGDGGVAGQGLVAALREVVAKVATQR